MTGRAYRGALVFAVGVSVAAGCVDFDTSRVPQQRGTFGRELYTVLCDRVGAQSLREDITGASFHAVCHPDANGEFADHVDPTQLPTLTDTTTPDGQPVSLAVQEQRRAINVSRIEALAHDRPRLVAAFDATVPATKISERALEPGECADPDAADVDNSGNLALQSELSAFLGRLVDLYNDDTIPFATRALGDALNEVKADPDLQAALARMDARAGYRPLPLALGVARPALAYPRLVELSRALLGDLLQAGSPGADAFVQSQRVLYEEFRTPNGAPPLPLLGTKPDPTLGGKLVLSRPRSLLESVGAVALTEDSAFMVAAPSYIVRRDPRGYARVALVNGAVPAPFVDADGDHLADVDSLGRFITNNASSPASPFFSIDGVDGPRDTAGRAVQASNAAALLYDYVDVHSTFLAKLALDLRPFFAPDPMQKGETAMNMVAAIPVLGGGRDVAATSTKQYPADPREALDWQLGHSAPPPPGLGTTPVTVTYRAFHPESSPLSELVYAVGQILGTPEIDDLLAVAQQLIEKHPEQMASFVGLALEVKALANKHPEAKLPATATFWDDLFVQLAEVSHESGLVEDILRGVAQPATLGLEQPLATYFTYKDDIRYDANDVNGPSVNVTVPGQTSLAFVTPVDRTQPDTGTNKSEMQKFLSLLHDTNNLAICTKDGATVPISMSFLGANISFIYPTDPFYTPLICGLVGGKVPPKTGLGRCDIFGYQNVITLLLDVLLGKAQLTVRDDCLGKLLASPLPGLVGGADAFLQQISGVQGFSLHPNLRGFARLLYFQTPFAGLPSDPNATTTNKTTATFLSDTITPIESMACPLAPFKAPDGTVFPLRNCTDVNDLLRGRDPDALFPVDELGFVAALQPLATAFDKHKAGALFANLFDVLHLHWGSPQQTKKECDPTLPRTDGRWCSQDGLVTYEPLLTDIIDDTPFERIQGLLGALGSIQVPHCTSYDPSSHVCTAATPIDGIHAIAQAVELLFDPKRMPGLTDRSGNTLALRNDGTRTDPIAPIDLVVDAFDGIDAAFTAYAAAHPGDEPRHDLWLSARSHFVDTFLAVNGAGAQATFANQAVVKILPTILELVREQTFAHCPGLTQPCTWAKHDLPSAFDDTIRGPAFAAVVDLVESLRADSTARTEIEQLVGYLIDALSANDARTGTLSSVADVMGILQDDTNLQPLEQVLAIAASSPVSDDQGNVVRRGLVDAGVRVLSRMFEKIPDPSGCWATRDPNRVLGAIMTNLVTPMSAMQPTPVEILDDVIADVNRSDPSMETKLDGADYGNIANEVSDFLLDPGTGLEQVYAIVKQATQPTQ